MKRTRMRRSRPMRRGPIPFRRTGAYRQLPVRERFELSFTKADGDACWEWIGTRVRGYGQFVVDGKRVYAHRMSYEIHAGAVPAELDVLHSCDNPGCVNPRHLRLGTHLENMRDREARGRGRTPLTPMALTEDQVVEVRRSAEPTRFLAARYGVSKTIIKRVRAKKSKYRSRIREVDYMMAVKRLPCAALLVPGHLCSGPVEADHAGSRGIGRKAHDSTVIPLCQQGHRERTDFSGPFRGWDQAQMREFLAGRIIQTQRFMRARGWTIPSSSSDIGEEVSITTTGPTPIAIASVTVHIGGRRATAAIESQESGAIAEKICRLAEDLREDGDIDVRNPEAALAASLVEGDR